MAACGPALSVPREELVRQGWIRPGHGLIVVTPRHHFLARGPKVDGVLVLSRVAALDVAQRRVPAPHRQMNR
jgi:hypothetical protein